MSFYSCFNSEWVICEYLNTGLTLLNVAILKTYSELGNNFTNIRKLMPYVNYLAKVIKDDAFVQQSLLGQDNDLREALFFGQRLKRAPEGAASDLSDLSDSSD